MAVGTDGEGEEEEVVQEGVEGTGEGNKGWDAGEHGEDEAAAKNGNGGRGARSAVWVTRVAHLNSLREDGQGVAKHGLVKGLTKHRTHPHVQS